MFLTNRFPFNLDKKIELIEGKNTFLKMTFGSFSNIITNVKAYS